MVFGFDFGLRHHHAGAVPMNLPKNEAALRRVLHRGALLEEGNGARAPFLKELQGYRQLKVVVAAAGAQFKVRKQVSRTRAWEASENRHELLRLLPKPHVHFTLALAHL